MGAGTSGYIVAVEGQIYVCCVSLQFAVDITPSSTSVVSLWWIHSFHLVSYFLFPLFLFKLMSHPSPSSFPLFNSITFDSFNLDTFPVLVNYSLSWSWCWLIRFHQVDKKLKNRTDSFDLIGLFHEVNFRCYIFKHISTSGAFHYASLASWIQSNQRPFLT